MRWWPLSSRCMPFSTSALATSLARRVGTRSARRLDDPSVEVPQLTGELVRERLLALENLNVPLDRVTEVGPCVENVKAGAEHSGLRLAHDRVVATVLDQHLEARWRRQ